MASHVVLTTGIKGPRSVPEAQSSSDHRSDHSPQLGLRKFHEGFAPTGADDQMVRASSPKRETKVVKGSPKDPSPPKDQKGNSSERNG